MERTSRAALGFAAFYLYLFMLVDSVSVTSSYFQTAYFCFCLFLRFSFRKAPTWSQDPIPTALFDTRNNPMTWTTTFRPAFKLRALAADICETFSLLLPNPEMTYSVVVIGKVSHSVKPVLGISEDEKQIRPSVFSIVLVFLGTLPGRSNCRLQKLQF